MNRLESAYQALIYAISLLKVQKALVAFRELSHECLTISKHLIL